MQPQRFEGTDTYVATQDLQVAVNAAIALERPLLIKGEPGTGKTILHDYYFHWDGDPDGEGSGAVALGLVALCNHSRRPNARVRRNLAQETLDLLALAPIAAGDEVTIDYNCPLWFDPQE